MTDIGVMVSAGGAILALLTFVVMSHRYQTDRLEAAREQLRTEMRALAESESKRRHDLANNVHAAVGKVEVQAARLEREMARREDLSAMESRNNQVFDKLFAKLESVSERLAGVSMLEKQFVGIEAKLDRVLEKSGGD